MSGCPRTFCPNCDGEMIHRDNRRGYESASALGQIVSRAGPRTFTVGDVDLYVLKFFGREVLLRLLEHKQPAAPVKPMQRETLRLLDACLAAAIEHPLSPKPLHAASGVYLIRGEVGAEPSGRRATCLAGPQRVWNPRAGWHTLETQDQVFAWMDGKLELGEVAA